MATADAFPEIEVIVVNYNAGDALTRCVKSVFDQLLPVRIMVFDNASSDSSILNLQKIMAGKDRLVIHSSENNLGFARAINAAIVNLSSEAKYLLILNPDCEMLPGSLDSLRSELQQDPRAALAGPLVVDRQGRAMRGTMRRFPDPWSSLRTFTGLWRLGRWFPAFGGVEKSAALPEETTQAEAVSGACMLLRVSEFIEAGRMDGAYGLHCEDLDLMFRLHQRGFHCLYVPSARVFHDQGVSSASRPLWVHWQKHRGMQRFFQKFQAEETRLPLRWLVIAGIWIRFAVTLPLAWFRR
jgi:GT2 family glycosyltransferase